MLNDWLKSGNIRANHPKHLRFLKEHTKDDLVLAAAKIGLEYVQLWNDNNSTEEIIRKKLADIHQRHQNIYNNKMNEAAHISWIIYEAALSDQFAGSSSSKFS